MSECPGLSRVEPSAPSVGSVLLEALLPVNQNNTESG